MPSWCESNKDDDLDTGQSGSYKARLCIKTEARPGNESDDTDERPDDESIETEARPDDKSDDMKERSADKSVKRLRSSDESMNSTSDIEQGLLNSNENVGKLGRGNVMRDIFINHDEPSTEFEGVNSMKSVRSRLGTEVGMKLGPIVGTNDAIAEMSTCVFRTQNKNEMNNELDAVADSSIIVYNVSFKL